MPVSGTEQQGNGVDRKPRHAKPDNPYPKLTNRAGSTSRGAVFKSLAGFRGRPTFPLLQGGAVVARLAHNQEVESAILSPATSFLSVRRRYSGVGGRKAARTTSHVAHGSVGQDSSPEREHCIDDLTRFDGGHHDQRSRIHLSDERDHRGVRALHGDDFLVSHKTATDNREFCGEAPALPCSDWRGRAGFARSSQSLRFPP
jgi:hypothetical protein